MQTNKIYPLAEPMPGYQRHRLGAVSTGEYRAPKAGEWYLSGAIVEAWQALNDLTTKYHIARIHHVTYPAVKMEPQLGEPV